MDEISAPVGIPGQSDANGPQSRVLSCVLPVPQSAAARTRFESKSTASAERELFSSTEIKGSQRATIAAGASSSQPVLTESNSLDETRSSTLRTGHLYFNTPKSSTTSSFFSPSYSSRYAPFTNEPSLVTSSYKSASLSSSFDPPTTNSDPQVMPQARQQQQRSVTPGYASSRRIDNYHETLPAPLPVSGIKSHAPRTSLLTSKLAAARPAEPVACSDRPTAFVSEAAPLSPQSVHSCPPCTTANVTMALSSAQRTSGDHHTDTGRSNADSDTTSHEDARNPNSSTNTQDLHMDIANHPVGEVIVMLTALVQKIIEANDALHSQSVEHVDPSNLMASNVLAFHGRNIPAIGLHAYLTRILKYCPTTNEVFIALLVYFDRIAHKVNGDNARSSDNAQLFVMDSYNIHRLIITGITVASKFFSDVFYKNSRYAKVGGLPVEELNHLELQFLLLTDFRLMITLEELQKYSNLLLRFWIKERMQSV